MMLCFFSSWSLFPWICSTLVLGFTLLPLFVHPYHGRGPPNYHLSVVLCCELSNFWLWEQKLSRSRKEKILQTLCLFHSWKGNVWEMRRVLLTRFVHFFNSDDELKLPSSSSIVLGWASNCWHISKVIFKTIWIFHHRMNVQGQMFWMGVLPAHMYFLVTIVASYFTDITFLIELLVRSSIGCWSSFSFRSSIHSLHFSKDVWYLDYNFWFTLWMALFLFSCWD